MNIKEFLENIFSIKSYNKTHRIMRIFGIKIKYPKLEYSRRRSASPYHYYKKHNIDITTLPPAIGQTRDIQLANFVLLKELDYVCKENGLTYWIDFGSLLGAIRHRGFIPWDDDIDTGMMREDYNKVIKAFKKSSRNPDIYAAYYRDPKTPCQYYIKVQHRKTPLLFVDIFPYDFYGKPLSKGEQYRVTAEIKEMRELMRKYYKPGMSNDEVKIAIKTSIKNILDKDCDKETSDVVWGLDFNHHWKNWLYRHDIFFPLREIEFEGKMFPCINKPDEFLSEVYGDYMAYPNKIGIGHSMFSKINRNERRLIRQIISEGK